ncbi:hypothetical protein AC578_6175 [Pseudocercospora eumusae]|uniref:Uncharacterized protein n=1 Tax=Pseudocercospora eumusae TaxID=321146 RepID=A0A139H989_9PEZI|nr:hypothetical protein AC578_6175 [Pseudocercospora eumusae]
MPYDGVSQLLSSPFTPPESLSLSRTEISNAAGHCTTIEAISVVITALRSSFWSICYGKSQGKLPALPKFTRQVHPAQQAFCYSTSARLKHQPGLAACNRHQFAYISHQREAEMLPRVGGTAGKHRDEMACDRWQEQFNSILGVAE